MQGSIDLECLNFCELGQAAMMSCVKSVTGSWETAISGVNEGVWITAIVAPRRRVIVQVTDVGYKQTWSEGHVRYST